MMHMRVDAARHDDMPGGVDHARGGLRRQRTGRGDRGDGPAGHGDIATDDALRRHHVAAANDEIEHHDLLSSRGSG